MLSKLAYYVVNLLQKHGAILDSEKALIMYGAEITLSTLGYILSTIIIAILLGKPVFALVFILFFMLERLFIGGYHSSTYLRCFLTTNAIFLTISLITIITPEKLTPFLSAGTTLISFPYMLVKAPVVNSKNPLSKRRLDRDKKIGRIILVLQACVILICPLFMPAKIKYFYFASVSYLVACILMIIVKVRPIHQ